MHDFSITGPGLIYGKGLSFGAGPGRGQQAGLRGFGPERGAGAPAPAAPAQPATPPNPARMARGDYPMYQAEQPGVGNKAIALKNCRNVLLRDFSILKGGHFALLLTGVDNLTIDNVTLDTDRDGMDIDCCQNVRVSNCTVNSPWDDGICPKSSYALGYNRATRNVTIANCFVTGCYQLGTVLDGTWKKFPAGARAYGTGRIKCGTESNGGFINITITGCVFEGCQGYALETVDGALLEDIAITNTTMRDIISPPLFMRLGARLRGPKDTTKVGTLKRILVNNLVCHNAPMRVTSILSGIPNYPIEDVKLSNIYIENLGGATADAAAITPPEKEDAYPEPSMFGQMPSLGFFMRHMRNVEMSHVELATLTPDARPAFYLQDVQRADFFAITAPRTAGQSASGNFALNNVKDLRIGWSRAAADTVLDTADNKLL
jgi:polygalacturonase